MFLFDLDRVGSLYVVAVVLFFGSLDCSGCSGSFKIV